VSEPSDRGFASTTLWEATCKDCRGESLASTSASRQPDKARGVKASQVQRAKEPKFEYSSEWAERMLDRGNTRSDRCERHRKAHRVAIQALAVPYISLSVIGEVLNPQRPSGPLGGLGPLPLLHKERTVEVDLGGFEFGMTDQDVLQILDGLREKQVAVIEAGTGTGKSTFMLFRLMNPPAEAPFSLSQRGPIIVTEPRRAAAKGVARFVGEELCLGHDSRTCSNHIGPGFAVGYQVSGEQHWDGACELVYVTDGTMINWVRDGHLSRIGAVIIDEVHERSENIDIILAQLREKIGNYKHLRVIITSATLDKNFFVEYFGGPARVFHLSIPPKKAFGYGVPFFVDTQIDDDIVANGLTIGGEVSSDSVRFDGWSKWGPEQGGYPPEDLRATTRQLQALRCVDAVPVEEWKKQMPSALARQIVAIAKGTEWGDILGFLPTTATIDYAVGEINEQLVANGLRSRFDVYPLLATTDKNISDKATAARSRGEKRKIVVSSNLAETSLTVKGVRYVVDSGLICQPEWDPQLASGSYPTKPHSQSGVRQRWGRVGRDAPGWVFPLYTVEHFLSLPRSTPPGSAQTNLESFYMKLMAAGVDLEDAVLPANFRHESVSCDAGALQIIETFEKESKRAQHALRLAGAVDSDGHLTEYGRDLERFPGTGSEALALMLAEQLACIHEVALALYVLGQGRLVGKNDSSILRIDQEWPAAWRVAAAQRHRGLTIGCDDDLDIILRICALWQSADDSPAWCATWWINEEALASAWAATMDTVKTLSAAMKGEAFRPIVPALAGRARAVLTRTMVSLRYERLDGAQFCGVTASSEKPEIVLLSRSQLVDSGDRILAFNRFRLPPANDDEPGRAFISHAVRIVDWAQSTHEGSDDMGLDLIVRAATHLREQLDVIVTPVDILNRVRAHLPVGTVLDLALEGAACGPMRILSASVSQSAFRRPAELALHAESSDDNFSGFDREWDPLGAIVEADLPEEEAALQILNPRDSELNDGLVHESGRPRSTDATTTGQSELSTSLPTLYALTAWENIPLSPTTKGRIVGYRIIDSSNVTLVIEPLGVSAPIDPAEHPDLDYGQDIEVSVCGVVRDHEREFVQLARTDGLGYFYLSATTAGLSYYDRNSLTRLAPGAVFTGLVVAGEANDLTVTLLPALHADLAHATAEMLPVDGESTVFYAAKIIEAANKWGKLRIELEHGQPEKGLSHQFEIRQQDLRAIHAAQPEIGFSLLVALERDRGRNQKALKIRRRSERLTAFLKTRGDVLVANGDQIDMGDTDVSSEVIRELQDFDSSQQWCRSVWEFYTASLRRSVRAVRPQVTRAYVTCGPAIVSLLRERRRDIQDRYGVVIRTADPANRIEIASPQVAAAEEAAKALNGLEGLPRILAALPPNTAGLVLGKEHANRKRLEAGAGVRWVWVDGDKVGMVGETDHAVERTFEAIRAAVATTTGQLVVPLGKNGLLIGTKGATIQRLKDSTGCQARNLNRGETWIVDGPTEAAVREFLRMARQIVGGTSRIVSSRELRIIENTTKGASSRPRRRGEVRSAAGTHAGKQDSRCFIATACYGNIEHPDIIVLRRWRDGDLLRSSAGQMLVRSYYRLSPAIAKFLTKRKAMAKVVRVLMLQPMVRLVRHRL